MSLACRQCGQPITFDDKHISQRTGKKIPLHVGTNERHNCPMWNVAGENSVAISQSNSQQQQTSEQRRYHQCNKGCGQEIYFDANSKSQSGKWIPLDKQTGLPHQCQ